MKMATATGALRRLALVFSSTDTGFTIMNTSWPYDGHQTLPWMYHCLSESTKLGDRSASDEVSSKSRKYNVVAL